MNITLRIGHHEYRRNVKALPERDNNGFGGFGYGGTALFAAWNEDCFDPPIYLIRADGWSDAYDVAINSLAPVVTDDDLGRPVAEFCEGEWADEGGYAWAEDGQLVYTEALRLKALTDAWD